MELSKALLGALLLGIAVEASSCKKDNTTLKPQSQQTDVATQPAGQQPNHVDGPPVGDPCPACGMG